MRRGCRKGFGAQKAQKAQKCYRPGHSPATTVVKFCAAAGFKMA